MGNTGSLINRAEIVYPKTIKLKYDGIQKCTNNAFIYFTPKKKIYGKFIKIEIKREEKPLETFSIFIKRDELVWNKIGITEFYEYTHMINPDDSNRKILIRTDMNYKIFSIVYVLPPKCL